MSLLDTLMELNWTRAARVDSYRRRDMCVGSESSVLPRHRCNVQRSTTMFDKFLALPSPARRATLTVALFLVSFITAELSKNDFTDMLLAFSMIGWFVTSGLIRAAFLFFKLIVCEVLKYQILK